MAGPNFNINQDSKMLFLTRGGPGKSVLLLAEAQRLGITYEELLKRLGPTEEEKEQTTLHQAIESDLAQGAAAELACALDLATATDTEMHDSIVALRDVYAELEAQLLPALPLDELKAILIVLRADYSRLSARIFEAERS